MQQSHYELRDNEAIEIYDIVGKIVYQINKLTNQQQITKSTNNQITIDVSHLASGVYYLKVSGKVFKIMKE